MIDMYNILESERQFIVDVLLECYNRLADDYVTESALEEDLVAALELMGEKIE